jgi:hypothetical protein
MYNNFVAWGMFLNGLAAAQYVNVAAPALSAVRFSDFSLPLTTDKSLGQHPYKCRILPRG